jgi:hypothetical protein
MCCKPTTGRAVTEPALYVYYGRHHVGFVERAEMRRADDLDGKRARICRDRRYENGRNYRNKGSVQAVIIN